MTDSLKSTLLQTNKSTAPPESVVLDISCHPSATFSKLQLMLFYSVCESKKKSICNHILTHISLARDTVGRRGIETTGSAQKGYRRGQIHSNHFLSMFHLFHSSLIQNLPQLYLTKVGHLQSNQLVSQRKHFVPR